MASRSTFPPEDDEDTVELELSAEEMRGLSRAAKEAEASRSKSAGTGPFRLWPVTLVAALVGVAAVVAWRPGPPHRIAPRIASLPAPAVPPPAAPAPAVLAVPAVPAVPQESPPPAAAPVRMKNPFDATEVFEFPPGTTRAEARQKISELLLQRAVDRGSAGQRGEAAGKQRPKNN